MIHMNLKKTDKMFPRRESIVLGRTEGVKQLEGKFKASARMQ